jgi:hypothetical protein
LGEVFLGVIAVATLAMAIVQVGVIVAAGRLARRVEELADRLEQDVKPLFGHLNAIGRDAPRAAAPNCAQPGRTSCSPMSRSGSTSPEQRKKLPGYSRPRGPSS